MRPHIQQYVIPRRRNGTSSRFSLLSHRYLAANSRPAWTSSSFQRGIITHGTIATATGLIALLFASLLGFLYLQQVLGTASQGTDIHALESKVVELRERQRALELEGAELRSLQTVEEQVQKLNLVKTGDVTYLTSQPDRVAAIPE